MTQSNGHTKRCVMCERKVISGELCHMHAESWARTQGLIAQLALPPLQSKSGAMERVVIEVETQDGSYKSIKTMSVDADRIVIVTDDDTYLSRSMKDGVPPWRRR